MNNLKRRDFLAKSLGSVAITSLASRSYASVIGAGERVRIALLGCGNQGKSHLSGLKNVKNAELVWVCDVDGTRLEEAKSAEGSATQATQDLRRVLDDQTLDGVIIALPDHWHVPAALLSLDAGKHVYLEKPFAHNLQESRWLLEKTRQKDLVFQHGTQSRSNDSMRSAIAMLKEGVIGKVTTAKCWNWQKRSTIGRQKPSSSPTNVNYNDWVGPAAWLPYQSNRFHYDWHWWYNFGTGGMGNDGAHELDYALWGLGVTEHPSVVSGVGGNFYFDDDREWPDTQQVTMLFGGNSLGSSHQMLTYEQRLWSTSYPFNVDAGVEFHGTEGRMLLSKRGKIDVRGPRNKRIEIELYGEFGHSVARHQQDWIDGIRLQKATLADAEMGHRVATVISLGNIVARLGRTIEFDYSTETILNDAIATGLSSRRYRHDGHWAIPSQA